MPSLKTSKNKDLDQHLTTGISSCPLSSPAYHVHVGVLPELSQSTRFLHFNTWLILLPLGMSYLKLLIRSSIIVGLHWLNYKLRVNFCIP